MAYEVANGSSTIQADYELLEKIALHCIDCANVTTNFNHTIMDQLHILQNGNWEGDAADQFFITMMHDVMPGFDRLIQSFQAGETTLNNLVALFQGADEEAAAGLIFGDDIAGEQTGLVAGHSAGSHQFAQRVPANGSPHPQQGDAERDALVEELKDTYCNSSEYLTICRLHSSNWKNMSLDELELVKQSLDATRPDFQVDDPKQIKSIIFGGIDGENGIALSMIFHEELFILLDGDVLWSGEGEEYLIHSQFFLAMSAIDQVLASGGTQLPNPLTYEDYDTILGGYNIADRVGLELTGNSPMRYLDDIEGVETQFPELHYSHLTLVSTMVSMGPLLHEVFLGNVPLTPELETWIRGAIRREVLGTNKFGN